MARPIPLPAPVMTIRFSANTVTLPIGVVTLGSCLELSNDVLIDAAEGAVAHNDKVSASVAV